MATPEVAGAAALLLQSHPSWTVEEVKSALVSTAVPAKAAGTRHRRCVKAAGASTSPSANVPLLFTRPTALGWGLVRRGTLQEGAHDRGRRRRRVSVDGVGRAAEAARRREAQSGLDEPRRRPDGQAPAHDLAARAPGRRHGLRRAHARQRRTPRAVLVPRRGPEAPARSAPNADSPGVYNGDTIGGPSRVSRYLFPQLGIADGVPTQPRRTGGGLPVPAAQAGCELRRRHPRWWLPRLAAPCSQRRREPTRRLHGASRDVEPVRRLRRRGARGRRRPPQPGVYDFVFDTPTGRQPGPFTFRFWINDTTRPTIKLLTRTVTAGKPIRVAVHDAGAGVDRNSCTSYSAET